MLKDRRDSEAGRAPGEQRDRRSEAGFAGELRERQDSAASPRTGNVGRCVDGGPGDGRPDRGGDPEGHEQGVGPARHRCWWQQRPIASTRQTLLRRPVESGQCTSIDYTQTLADHGALASVGSVGDAYDNAPAESFVDGFKTELRPHLAYAIAARARRREVPRLAQPQPPAREPR